MEYFSESTMKAIDQVIEVNREGGVPQEVFLEEECAEYIKEWTKIQRHKGSEERMLSEAMDIMSALVVLFVSKGVSHADVESHVMNKVHRAIERYETNGEV